MQLSASSFNSSVSSLIDQYPYLHPPDYDGGYHYYNGGYQNDSLIGILFSPLVVPFCLGREEYQNSFYPKNKADLRTRYHFDPDFHWVWSIYGVDVELVFRNYFSDYPILSLAFDYEEHNSWVIKTLGEAEIVFSQEVPGAIIGRFFS
jgi:hypothetical protein